MSRAPRSTGRLALMTSLIVCLSLPSVACGGGGEGHGRTLMLADLFDCSGAATPAANQIALGCPSSSSSPIPITVVIGGPTISTDIYGIKFDLVFSPAVMTFLPPAIEGTFLNQGGVATDLIASTAPGDPGRLIVTITRQGAIGGLQAAASQTTVMTLLFNSTGAGTTSLAFANMQAVDSSLTPIGAITFGGPLSITFR